MNEQIKRGSINMIGPRVKALLLEADASFLITDEKVAYVQDNHPASHAFLILSQAGYSKIPVLDQDNKFKGFISLNHLTKAMFTVDGIDPDRLSEVCVADLMDQDAEILVLPLDIEDILHELVDHPFLPVVDEAGYFKGIVTRREVLKAVNHLMHSLEQRYELIQIEEEAPQLLAWLQEAQEKEKEQ